MIPSNKENNINSSRNCYSIWISFSVEKHTQVFKRFCIFPKKSVEFKSWPPCDQEGMTKLPPHVKSCFSPEQAPHHPPGNQPQEPGETCECQKETRAELLSHGIYCPEQTPQSQPWAQHPCSLNTACQHRSAVGGRPIREVPFPSPQVWAPPQLWTCKAPQWPLRLADTWHHHPHHCWAPRLQVGQGRSPTLSVLPPLH